MNEVTTFDEVYDQFFEKINDYTWLEYTEEEIRDYFFKTLKMAMGRFSTCDKLKMIDYDMEEISVQLTLQELEIIVELMVLMWIEKQVNDVTRFKDRLASKDYSQYSKANLLDKILATKKDKLSETDKLKGEYGSSLCVEFMKKSRGR